MPLLRGGISMKGSDLHNNPLARVPLITGGGQLSVGVLQALYGVSAALAVGLGAAAGGGVSVSAGGSFLELEDASGHFQLEDASGSLLLEACSFGAGLLFVGDYTDCSNNALSQASVDNVLVRLAALDGTGGTTSYDNKTVDLSGGTDAAPSATGLAAKATLEGRGCTVTVN